MPKKIYMDWQRLDRIVSSMALDIKDSECECTGVYGLPRGGLVPAVMLSHKLGVPLLMAPCKGCIVVDDIADTGVTLKHYAECGYRIAVIWYKPHSCVVPDFCGIQSPRSKNGGAWIVFPWETPAYTEASAE